MAELAQHGAVQLHLVDLAGLAPAAWRIAVGIGVGNEQILVCAFGNAVRPGGAHIGVGGLPFQVVVQHDIAVVAAVGDIDIALVIHLQAVGQIVFILPLADLLAAILRQVTAVAVILDDAVVAVAVGDKDVARRIPGDIGGAAQGVFLVRRIGALGRGRGAVGGQRAMADHHQHLGAFGVELGDDIGALVHRPDIVVMVHPHRMGELETIEALADFLDELAVGAEFPQPGLRPAEKRKDMSLGVGGDALKLAHIVALGRLEEIGHRLVRQVRRGVVGDSRRLRQRRHGACHEGCAGGACHHDCPQFHENPSCQTRPLWRGRWLRAQVYTAQRPEQDVPGAKFGVQVRD